MTNPAATPESGLPGRARRSAQPGGNRTTVGGKVLLDVLRHRFAVGKGGKHVHEAEEPDLEVLVRHGLFEQTLAPTLGPPKRRPPVGSESNNSCPIRCVASSSFSTIVRIFPPEASAETVEGRGPGLPGEGPVLKL